jgi:alcohol dehydrogenase
MASEARAMVFEGPGQPLRPRQFALPHLAPGELLVRVHACTLCGSDLHTYEGRRRTPCPTILGHEIVGRVEGVPPDGLALDHERRPLQIGDRVVWSLAVGCSACFFCAHELPQKCAHLVKYGHAAIGAAHVLSGGLATHCHLLRGTAVYRVPEDVPDLVACPATCATATAAAALRHAGDVDGGTVLIQGAGMLGLTAAALAAARGAAALVVADVDPARTALATRFGATHATADMHEVPDLIRALTDGRGADVVIEMSGAPAAIEAGLELLRIGGCYVWIGTVFPTRAVSISPESIVRRHLTIHGVHNYHPRDLGEALAFLGAHHHRHPFAELVGGRFHLEEADTAFRFAARERPVRVAVTM